MSSPGPTGLARLKKPAVEITVKHNSEPDGDEKPEEKKYDDWQLKDHADTLARAEEIKNDPHLMRALKPHLEKKAKAYKSLAQLRRKAAMLPSGE